jgi:hypothetical protein
LRAQFQLLEEAMRHRAQSGETKPASRIFPHLGWLAALVICSYFAYRSAERIPQTAASVQANPPVTSPRPKAFVQSSVPKASAVAEAAKSEPQPKPAKPTRAKRTAGRPAQETPKGRPKPEVVDIGDCANKGPLCALPE